jgi:predicted metal-binding membrane protein
MATTTPAIGGNTPASTSRSPGRATRLTTRTPSPGRDQLKGTAQSILLRTPAERAGDRETARSRGGSPRRSLDPDGGNVTASRAGSLYALVAGVAGVSWIAMWQAQQSPYARYLHHDSAAGPDAGVPSLALFVAGWSLMVVATMLPTTLPLLAAFRHVVRLRPRRGALEAAVVAGFIGVWAACGYLAWSADAVVHAAVAALPWLAERPQLIVSAALACAGAYQLSAFKQRCLDLCRSPRGVLFRHWGGRGSAPRQALTVGAAHGVSCLGCCWPLMLLMFAFGLGSLGWMLLLAALMGLEKNAPFGPRLARPLGLALLASAPVVALAG